MGTRDRLLRDTQAQFRGTCGNAVAGVDEAAADAGDWASEEGASVLRSMVGRPAVTGAARGSAERNGDRALWLRIATEFDMPIDVVPTETSPFFDKPSDIPAPSAPDFDGAMPCTAAAQEVLHAYQTTCTAGGGERRGFLESRLKEGMHGVGSAVTLLAHDMLAAIMVGRIFTVPRTRWFFAPAFCPSPSWECLYGPATPCVAEGGGSAHVVSSVHEARKSKSPTIRKKSYDVSGMTRNDGPSIEDFFGKKHARCGPLVHKWAAASGQSVYIMGTIARGADPVHGYMLAQATRYLMRAPQPWFAAMIRHHAGVVFRTPGELARAVYVQDRGEIAKYREYYAAFGCHTFHTRVFEEIPRQLPSPGRGGGPVHPVIYVSGNTPRALFDRLSAAYASPWSVRSVWSHPALATAGNSAETKRWGASRPFSSWVDLYVGVGSGAWVCAVSSNWCRVINFLRLTAPGSALPPRRRPSECPFVDLGLLMLANATARAAYCRTDPEWPSKPFSGAARNVEM
jgi:hypothetical protein